MIRRASGAACRRADSGAPGDALIGHGRDDALAVPWAEDRPVDDGQPVALEREAPLLVRARPALIPGDLDMMDHRPAGHAVAARIGGEALEESERFLIGRREAFRLAPLA